MEGGALNSAQPTGHGGIQNQQKMLFFGKSNRRNFKIWLQNYFSGHRLTYGMPIL